ncbi:hypothetical protein SAMN02799630_03922 [Paenibacillus sp. UNCCL117]|nr:hypothetical protein SAMN04488602_11013 [Paenibacillus sp. cl123]SFW51581.1 hypothetical protein SAMN02799630_03922 [Paenibacillus sp. UNCCL117]
MRARLRLSPPYPFPFFDISSSHPVFHSTAVSINSLVALHLSSNGKIDYMRRLTDKRRTFVRKVVHMCPTGDHTQGFCTKFRTFAPNWRSSAGVLYENSHKLNRPDIIRMGFVRKTSFELVPSAKKPCAARKNLTAPARFPLQTPPISWVVGSPSSSRYRFIDWREAAGPCFTGSPLGLSLPKCGIRGKPQCQKYRRAQV